MSHMAGSTGTGLQPGSAGKGGCSFCALVAGRSGRTAFHSVLGPGIGQDYLLAGSKSFVALPSLGSLVPGFVLVLPRRHVLSLGHLPNSFDDELSAFLADIERRLAVAFGSSLVFFEHGAATSTETGGSCSDHAHLHVAPVPPSVDLRTCMEHDSPARKIDSMGRLRAQASAGRPYLFLRHHDGGLYLSEAWSVSSQHFRRALAHQLGVKDRWDWAVFPEADNMRATMKSFGRASRTPSTLGSAPAALGIISR